MMKDNVHSKKYTGLKEKKFVVNDLTTSISSNLNQTNGQNLLFHQSIVTLTARMWPPIEEAEPPSNVFLGLPFIVWGILIGCAIIFLLLLISLFFYFYLLPRQHKYLTQTAIGNNANLNNAKRDSAAITTYSSSSLVGDGGGILGNESQLYNTLNEGTLNRNNMSSSHHNHQHINQQQYHHHHHQQQQINHQPPTSSSLMMINGEIYHQTVNCSGHCINNLSNNLGSSQTNNYNNIHLNNRDNDTDESKNFQPTSTHCIPETHKSMWAVNTFYDSSQEISDVQSNYRTRSLPSWGKNGKPRPSSTVDDLDELYAQVNFTKKRRNRMRNDNAAIIARCRSRSQNLTSLHLESEGVVVYDERTAL